MDASKLESWLPVLQHPEHGVAICKAAGVISIFTNGYGIIELWLNDEGWGGYSDESLSASALAALAFGTLAVMATRGTEATLERVKDTWWVEQGNLRDPRFISVHADTLHAAVLAAAYRWLGIGGDK